MNTFATYHQPNSIYYRLINKSVMTSVSNSGSSGGRNGPANVTSQRSSPLNSVWSTLEKAQMLSSVDAEFFSRCNSLKMAPNNCGNKFAASRRASSFPIAHVIAMPSSLKVRSQSESAALNSMNIKVPRNLYHELEMCRNQWRCAGYNPSCSSSSPASFFTPQDDIQSDSEGDDSLVSSSEEGGSSSADNIDIAEEEHDDEEDLGVVRDLELYDRDIDTNNSHRFHQQHYLMAGGANGNDATTPLVGSPSSAASSTMMTAMAATASMASPFNVPLGGQSFSKKQLDATLALIQSKKAVKFADECGKCLETIRVMTEPSDYPPQINPAVIRRFRKAASLAAMANGDSHGNSSSSADEDDGDDEFATVKAPRSSWKITFRQPASEYVKFRETLEQQKVALENVMLKNDVGRMVGTIKVSNIAFKKRIFIRFTMDGWKSYFDREAVYQSSPSKTYDTFRFDIEIPRDTEKNARIEFCVCYEANDQQYWDSNNGKNFVLTASDYDQFPASPMPVKAKPPSPVANGARDFGSPRNSDAYCMDYDNWSKFASWKNLRTDTPYW